MSHKKITTAAERAELPAGTICMDEAGNAWKRGTGSWVGTGEGGPLYDDMDLTLTILHNPQAPTNQRDKIATRKIRELLKHLDSWERQEHATVTIKFLRRHFKEAE